MTFPFDCLSYFILLAILTLPLGWCCSRFIGWSAEESSGSIPFILTLGSSILPTLLFIAGHLFPISFLTAASCSFLGSAAFLAGARDRGFDRSIFRFSKNEVLFFAAVFSILLFFIGSQYFQPNHRPWYFPLVYDYVKHDGVIFALSQKTLPAINPFFHPGQDVSLSYYYLFHLIAAALPKLEGDSYQHLFACCAIWTGLAFLGSIDVFLLSKGWTAKKRGFAIAMLLLLSGLDILPTFQGLTYLLRDCPDTFAKCWSSTGLNMEFRFGGLLGNLVYAPQHILAIACVFLCIEFLRAQQSSPRVWLIFPLLALSLFGSSVYIGLGAAISCAAYAIYVRRFPKDTATARYILPGIFCSFVFLFWLAVEISPSSGAVNAGLRIDPFNMDPQLPINLWQRTQGFIRMFFSLLPLAVPVFFFGFKRSFSFFTTFEKALFAAFLLASMTIASNGPNNDFAIRAIVVARILLSLAASYALISFIEGKKTKTFVACVVVALPYFIPSLNHMLYWGIYRIKTQSSPSEVSMDYLEMIRYVKSDCDPKSAIQGNIMDISKLLMLSHRPVSYLDDIHSTLFNVDAVVHQNVRSKLIQATQQPFLSESAQTLNSLGIQCLLLKKGTFIESGNGSLKKLRENPHYVLWGTP